MSLYVNPGSTQPAIADAVKSDVDLGTISVLGIDSGGQLTANYDPQVPLKPTEWVDYLSPAASGRSIGLLASLVSGGQQQTFEGAFFVPVRPDGLGAPRRVAGRGPRFPTLIGTGSEEFIAAGDQEPLTLLCCGAGPSRAT